MTACNLQIVDFLRPAILAQAKLSAFSSFPSLGCSLSGEDSRIFLISAARQALLLF